MLKKLTAIFCSYSLIILSLPVTMADETCPIGKQFNSTLGRCTNTAATSTMRDNAINCSKIANEAERTACIKTNAENNTKGMTGEDAAKGANTAHQIAGSTVAGAALTLAVMNTVGSAGEQSNCTSKNIFAGAAVIGLLGEVYFSYFANSKLKEIQEEYKNFSATDQFTSQKKAFDFLQEEQEVIAKIADRKFKIYTAITAIYAVAAGFAAYEMYSPGTVACDAGVKKMRKDRQDQNLKNEELNAPGKPADLTPDSLKGPKPGEAIQTNNYFSNENIIVALESVRSFDRTQTKSLPYDFLQVPGLFKMALNHIIPSAEAEESKTRLIGLVIGGAAGMASLFAPVQEFFATSAGIFTASIVSGLLAATLAGAAKQQKEKALSNADKIEEVKKRFEASISNLCPNGRTDLKEPKCFCYLEGGKKNLTHLNSATCVALFAKNDASEFRAAGDFSVSDPNEPKLGCVTRVGEFDPNCGCKKVQDTKGQNLCRKSGLASINLGNVGNAINAGQTLSTADKLFSNQLQPAQLNAANLNQNAINTKKVTDAIVAKGAEKNINFPSKDKLNLFANNLVKNIGSAKNLEAAKNSSVLASLQSSSPPKGLDPAKLKEAIAKSGVEYEGGGGKKAAAKENNDFNFGYGADTAQAGAGGGGKVEEYMEKEYDYKNNDIVKRDDVAIWDVISNRYIQSGMKRLFENAPAQ